MTHRYAPLLFLLAMTAAQLFGSPPNQPHFDGRLVEYDASELRGTFTGTPAWPGTAMSNLYVTWDETNLYVALECRMDNTKVSVLLDVDPGNGTGSTTTTNWLEGDNVLFVYNDNGWQVSDAPGAVPFGLDFNIATEGWYNSVTLALYDGVVIPSTNNGARLFDMLDVGNGSRPIGTAVEMVVLRDSREDPYKGFETRIPWSTLYGSNTNRFGIVGPGQTVPTGATVRLFANIHDNSNITSISAPDTIPAQTSVNASYSNGLLITDTYIDVVIDQNNDGLPDLGSGDVNAPYLTQLIAVAGATTFTGVFNEVVTEASASNPSNWSFDGYTVLSSERIQPNRVVVTLDAPLPTAGEEVLMQTIGIEDLSGNSKVAKNSLVIRWLAFAANHSSMTTAGPFQGWDASERNMVLVDDFTWMHDRMLTVPGTEFKFAAGTWAVNWGLGAQDDSNTPVLGAAAFFGNNIAVTNVTAGMHRFIFNDDTLAFSCVKIDADTDMDDLPDGWETRHGLLPTDDGTGSEINGAQGDGDIDFVTNLEELIADTDPNDPFSFLSVYTLTRNPLDETVIRFPTSSNRTYTLEYSPLSTPRVWSSIEPTHMVGNGEIMSLTTTGGMDGLVYRIMARMP